MSRSGLVPGRCYIISGAGVRRFLGFFNWTGPLLSFAPVQRTDRTPNIGETAPALVLGVDAHKVSDLGALKEAAARSRKYNPSKAEADDLDFLCAELLEEARAMGPRTPDQLKPTLRLLYDEVAARVAIEEAEQTGFPSADGLAARRLLAALKDFT